MLSGAGGGTRTHNPTAYKAVALPVGATPAYSRWWTGRESNPFLLRAKQPYSRYTTGPNLILISITNTNASHLRSSNSPHNPSDDTYPKSREKLPKFKL